MELGSALAQYLAAPIHTRAGVLSRPSPVDKEPGVYGWWFRSIPAGIDATNCVARNGLTLLYAGISPKPPPKNGGKPSSESLRSRISTHYKGNAAGSTLRLSLGLLLADELKLELRAYGSGKRFLFGADEPYLSGWMHDNALVSWLVYPHPKPLEEEILTTLDLPLNTDGNARNQFRDELLALRAEAKARAKALPTLPNPGVGGASIAYRGNRRSPDLDQSGWANAIH